MSTASLPSAKLPLPEMYYSPGDRSYWRRNDRNQWIAVNEGSAIRYIRSVGYSDAGPGQISASDRCLLNIQASNSVDYVGPLAGHPAGLHQIRGRQVLVTNSPEIIQPAPGDWPVLAQLLNRLLGPEQLVYFHGWMKQGYRSVSTNQWMAGQVLVLAGPRGAGKSLVQRLITKMLGGRVAKPYQFLTDKTTFNGDHFGAEHLMIEDEAESPEIRVRRHLGANIKAMAVNEDHSCQARYQSAVALTPRWRVSISLNDEPERLLVLPPLDQDVGDKLMLLKVNLCPMPMPTDTPEQQRAFWDTLMAEIPAYLHFLQEFVVPPNLVAPRYGITHFHHPDLVEGLTGTSPETALLGLIDQHRNWRAEANPWEGTSNQIEGALMNNDQTAYRAGQLLKHTNSCGTYLGRLARQPNPRVSHRKVNGITQWTIEPPPGLWAEAPSAADRGMVPSLLTEQSAIRTPRLDAPRDGDPYGLPAVRNPELN